MLGRPPAASCRPSRAPRSRRARRRRTQAATAVRHCLQPPSPAPGQRALAAMREARRASRATGASRSRRAGARRPPGCRPRPTRQPERKDLPAPLEQLDAGGRPRRHTGDYQALAGGGRPTERLPSERASHGHGSCWFARAEALPTARLGSPAGVDDLEIRRLRLAAPSSPTAGTSRSTSNSDSRADHRFAGTRDHSRSDVSPLETQRRLRSPVRRE
jgi:hypothetical protein